MYISREFSRTASSVVVVGGYAEELDFFGIKNRGIVMLLWHVGAPELLLECARVSDKEIR